MQNTARVVIIGGGIGGLSALYHLCLEGCVNNNIKVTHLG